MSFKTPFPIKENQTYTNIKVDFSRPDAGGTLISYTYSTNQSREDILKSVEEAKVRIAGVYGLTSVRALGYYETIAYFDLK